MFRTSSFLSMRQLIPCLAQLKICIFKGLKVKIYPTLSAELATYITRFQWDMAKYPTKQSLRNIADIISKQTGQIEADLKTKSSAYNNLKGNLQNLEKKQT